MSASIFGDTLFVDLTNCKISKRPFTKKLASHYIGYRGYNAALLWETVHPRTDPLGPDNILIFETGPLTGTSASSPGCISVTVKSTDTKVYTMQ